MAAWFLTGAHRVADLHSCILDSGINPLYLGPHFYPTFNTDSKSYTTIIIGDSTGAINALTPGWMDPSQTQSVAVPGNHLCHDLMTFRKSIHTKNPKNIIVMTLGGNDLLAGISPIRILQNAKDLLNQLRNQFPNSKIVGIGIHPTLIRHANRQKDSFNNEMKAIWLNDKNSCYVDPLEAFQVKKGQSAKLEHMFENDSIHYNSVITLRLGKMIRKQCLVDF